MYNVSLQLDDGTVTCARFGSDHAMRSPVAQPRPFIYPVTYTTNLEANDKLMPTSMMTNLTRIATVPLSTSDFLPTIA